MKKFLMTALMLGTSVVFVPMAEAKSTATTVTAADPQVRIQIGRNRRYNRRYFGRARTVVTTRITRIGRWRYRETIRTTYLPNGTTRTVLISRQRLGRWMNY